MLRTGRTPGVGNDRGRTVQTNQGEATHPPKTHSPTRLGPVLAFYPNNNCWNMWHQRRGGSCAASASGLTRNDEKCPVHALATGKKKIRGFVLAPNTGDAHEQGVHGAATDALPVLGARLDASALHNAVLEGRSNRHSTPKASGWRRRQRAGTEPPQPQRLPGAKGHTPHSTVCRCIRTSPWGHRMLSSHSCVPSQMMVLVDAGKKTTTHPRHAKSHLDHQRAVRVSQ